MLCFRDVNDIHRRLGMTRQTVYFVRQVAYLDKVFVEAREVLRSFAVTRHLLSYRQHLRLLALDTRAKKNGVLQPGVLAFILGCRSYSGGARAWVVTSLRKGRQSCVVWKAKKKVPLVVTATRYNNGSITQWSTELALPSACLRVFGLKQVVDLTACRSRGLYLARLFYAREINLTHHGESCKHFGN